jgi:hypothetical protein
MEVQWSDLKWIIRGILNTAVAVCATCCNDKRTLRFAHKAFSCVSYDSHNKLL